MALDFSELEAVGKRITKLIPQVQHLSAFQDAHVVIVSAQLLGELVGRALAAKMHPINAALRERLFDGYGPLSTYAGRVDVAYGLGLFPKEIYDDLRAVNKVRVLFAHSTDYLNFSTPQIAAAANKIAGLNAAIPSLRERYMHRMSEIAEIMEGIEGSARSGANVMKAWRYSLPDTGAE